MSSVAAEPLPTRDEVPDYELPDVVVADQPHQLKALGDRTRMAILDLVLERAASVTELAAALGKPKSTVAHHVEVLRRAGLLRVVRTRKVRAITEAFYGRTGRTVNWTSTGLEHPMQSMLDIAVAEQMPDYDPACGGGFTIRHARIPASQADAFAARLVEVALEFTRLPREGEVVYGLIAGVYPTAHAVLPAAGGASDVTGPTPRSGSGASYWKLFTASLISNTGDGMGLIAYPWLASAVTRNPLLIGLVSVANRLPWLVFSLPAGVITDRVDRRVTMVVCDTLRAGLTVVVALVVLAARGSLPGVDQLDSVHTTRPAIYAVLLDRHACCSAWRRCCGTTAGRRSCPASSTRRSWRRPTAACGAPSSWPTPSSGRWWAASSSRSPSPCRSSSTPGPSRWPPASSSSSPGSSALPASTRSSGSRGSGS